MKLSNIQEEYLKAIYLLQKNEKGARVTDIARKMKKTKPTVNYAINNLKEEGLVEYEVYGEVLLTQRGLQQVQKILEACDIIYLFLNGILEIEEKIAIQEANKMKTVLEDETLNQLAIYTHKILGLHSLECGYNINNQRCIQCLRRKGEKRNDIF